MINGFLYEKNSSLRNEVNLYIEDKFYIIKSNEELIEKGKISFLTVSKRLGNTPRNIILESKKIFTTNENDLVDKLLIKKIDFLHLLESRLKFIILFFILSIVCFIIFMKYLVPFFSEKIAYKIPVNISNDISINSMKFLDKYLLSQSQIELPKQKEIEKIFQTEILNGLENKDFEYKLLFRNFHENNKQIANAFALPNGTIILTDALIRLSQNIDELKSIIYHEIAHVEKRDSLKLMIENSFTAVIIAIYLGDISFLGDLGVGVGTFMINSSYSRKHETQADIYSFEKMLVSGIDPINFITIMEKIENQYKMDNKNIPYFLSSHPQTKHRIDLALKYSKCFKEKKVPCE